MILQNKGWGELNLTVKLGPMIEAVRGEAVLLPSPGPPQKTIQSFRQRQMLWVAGGHCFVCRPKHIPPAGHQKPRSRNQDQVYKNAKSGLERWLLSHKS